MAHLPFREQWQPRPRAVMGGADAAPSAPSSGPSWPVALGLAAGAAAAAWFARKNLDESRLRACADYANAMIRDHDALLEDAVRAAANPADRARLRADYSFRRSPRAAPYAKVMGDLRFGNDPRWL